MDIRDYEEFLAHARRDGRRDLEADALGALGNLYGGAGQTQKALDCTLQALQIRISLGDRGKIAVTYKNLAGIYEVLFHNYVQAENYLQQALTLMRGTALEDLYARELDSFNRRRHAHGG